MSRRSASALPVIMTMASAMMMMMMTLLLSNMPVHATNDASANTNINNNWLEDCRTHGFDPWHLACSTCEILKEHAETFAIQQHHEKCLACCQAYKDGERQIRKKPYEAAVLVLHRKGFSPELESFLKEDWEGLVETKGTERLVKTRKASSINNNNMMEMDMFMMMSGPSATLHFFEKQVDEHIFESIDEKAKESVQLDGWKRDDIKDMIMTLLA